MLKLPINIKIKFIQKLQKDIKKPYKKQYQKSKKI